MRTREPSKSRQEPRTREGSRLWRDVGDTIAERVYRALKRDIVRGVYAAGEAISENELARQYRASRTPIREAAVRLQAEQLLRIVPNRGYFISQISARDVEEIYGYRAAVEGACAELAAAIGVAEEPLRELQRLAQFQYRMDDREGYLRFIEADTAFHVGIAKLTNNRLLVRAVEEMRCQMERIMYAGADLGYYGDPPVREHREILDAIVRRDPPLARQLMYEHILAAKDRLSQLAPAIPYVGSRQGGRGRRHSVRST